MPLPDHKKDDVTGLDPRSLSQPSNERPINRALMIQGWAGVALWMSIGLLLEGLLGYKAPAYLLDPQRRELFRLAHSHGVLLNVLLIAASLCGRYIAPPRFANHTLRIGSILMPLGFLVAGIWHPEGDPGLAIWIVPLGALLVIFGTILTAISWKSSRMSGSEGH
jgi:hypothetical protein